MQFGNLAGLVNGTESVVFDYTVTGSPVSSISTGNILNGDEDGWYTIIVQGIGAAGINACYIQFNEDTGNNYGFRGLYGTNTTAGSITGSADNISFFQGAFCGSASPVGFMVGRIYAKTGVVRLGNMVTVDYISGTTVTTVRSSGCVWNNTADNIVSMQLKHLESNGLAVGSRLIVLKSNNFTTGTPTGVITTPYIQGSWVRVGSSVLGGTASSVTFSGLDGDRDVVYYISAQIKGSGACGTTYIRPNNVSTQAAFGYQSIYASNTSKAGERAANSANYTKGICLGAYGTANTYYSSYSGFLFAKTGFVRPALITSVHDITGTTVTTIASTGVSWNETSTNITSIVYALEAGNFDTGSKFEIYALRPNG